MRHKFFEIENFKGIEKVRLDLNAHPQGNIYTLVGLNESGKTTILEAINDVPYFKRETLDPLAIFDAKEYNAYDLMPMGKRLNFNGRIALTAGYALDADDQKSVSDFIRANCDFELTEPVNDFTMSHYYTFQNSLLKEDADNNGWSIKFIGKKNKKARKSIELDRPGWLKAVGHVRSLLPSILYFPNFLFEFPSQIYLENPPSNPELHNFYTRVIQDVLTAIDDDLTIETHILERAKSTTPHARRSLDAVLLKVGEHITTVIVGAWEQVFKRKFGAREIQVHYDMDDSGRVFLQVRLREGSQIYAIGERSLGFRWFFAFLLLTHYRRFRQGGAKNVLFLLDEPASNLHSSAQGQLLTSFANFPANSSIIYTTHSHHLINPAWLEGTYVVKNEGLDYTREVDVYTSLETKVTLEKYRSFAAHHPDQTTYFQPILDVLDYSPGRLENIPDVVMVEGKNDFYTLKYLHEIITSSAQPLNLLPGGGASTLDDAIRLYIAWGRNFIVLLDADKAGVKERQRYIDLFGPMVEPRIFTLADIDASWEKWGLEKGSPDLLLGRGARWGGRCM